MSAPLYQNHHVHEQKPDSAHGGLWFDRFFNRYQVKGQEWEIPKPDDRQDAKRDWIKTVSGPVGQAEQLAEYTERQIALVRHLNGRSQRFRTDWHLVTGMGNPHPVENGFCWHPTLGVPYLTGSAVKGLVRAWVEGNDDRLGDDQKYARLKRWFGTEKKDDIAEQAGGFMFFDAIPDDRPYLLCDIMTPHMGKWYSDGDKGDANNSEAIPADWHEPKPVPFLAVKKAQLVFSIAPRLPTLVDELDTVFNALTQALEWLGAGAKTATGYGYFSLDDDFSQEQEAALARQTQALAEQQRLAMLSPIEKDIEAFLKPIQAPEHDTRLLQELEKGTWQGEDAKVVAQKIKILMEDAGKWMPDFAGENKQKVKLKQRSQSVLKYLQG
jgi:CRISPR-associated protein Cmr6